MWFSAHGSLFESSVKILGPARLGLSMTPSAVESEVHAGFCSPVSRRDFLDVFRRVRGNSHAICSPLETEDYVIQTMDDVSPPKWHLAHTTWFLETFLLGPHFTDYESFHPRYCFLFNSYYEAVGEQHPRPRRGLLSRPTVREIYEYRTHVDRHMEQLIEQADDALWHRIGPLVDLGINHEEQHQELLITDIKHILAKNPLRPAYSPDKPPVHALDLLRDWIASEGGVTEIGFEGSGFHYDNEGPRHRVYVQPHRLASHLVTNGEYLEFMQEGGYRDARYWLSEGWAAVQERGWGAPLYWENLDNRWFMMTLSGMREIREEEPVCHVSYFEADAFARWRGNRLPTETEWECTASEEALDGNFHESGRFHPAPPEEQSRQFFGDVWEWTQSPYTAYPGFQPAEGAVGEYNGKFMCNQYVLRGGSCATSRRHIRPTYRNFFPADARWQFSGIRLASD